MQLDTQTTWPRTSLFNLLTLTGGVNFLIDECSDTRKDVRLTLEAADFEMVQ